MWWDVSLGSIEKPVLCLRGPVLFFPVTDSLSFPLYLSLCYFLAWNTDREQRESERERDREGERESEGEEARD